MLRLGYMDARDGLYIVGATAVVSNNQIIDNTADKGGVASAGSALGLGLTSMCDIMAVQTKSLESHILTNILSEEDADDRQIDH